MIKTLTSAKNSSFFLWKIDEKRVISSVWDGRRDYHGAFLILGRPKVALVIPGTSSFVHNVKEDLPRLPAEWASLRVLLFPF